jgi:GrpB-like predicted nucleotidyltransferase (UPF0157 family)
MVRIIEVVPYDSGWPHLFRMEAEELAAVLGEDVVTIHHIGSTAIPGIAAKPIVDMLVEVRDIERIDDFNEIMIEKGYLPKGEFGIVGRRFFIKGSEEQRTHHIHVYGVGHPRVEEHLAFRDYMIAHAEEAEAYSRLKEELAGRYPHDIEGYMAGKDELIQAVIEKARVWRESGLADVGRH